MSETYSDWNVVPWYQKRLNVMLIWLFLIPVGLVLLWMNDVYYNKKDASGNLVEVKAWEKAAITVMSVVFVASFVLK